MPSRALACSRVTKCFKHFLGQVSHELVESMSRSQFSTTGKAEVAMNHVLYSLSTVLQRFETISVVIPLEDECYRISESYGLNSMMHLWFCHWSPMPRSGLIDMPTLLPL